MTLSSSLIPRATGFSHTSVATWTMERDEWSGPLPTGTLPGASLAEVLAQYAGRDDVAVFGLPRGGIPVAYEVAHALGAPLDVLVVRKLGVPGHEELAIGAIAFGGVRVLNDKVVSDIGI